MLDYVFVFTAFRSSEALRLNPKCSPNCFAFLKGARLDRMADPKTNAEEQLAAAREVMARRKEALEHLAQMEVAERIMERDREILRKLAE